MQIPKSFQVAGRTYKVRVDYKGRLEKKELMGTCNFPQGTIEISAVSEGKTRNREDIEHTFLHEVWHAIWYALGEDKIQHDEQKADAFCSLLHQVLTSGEKEN